ncbi:peptidoglycan editing factor PgeF [Curvibacter sp. RS43]|uniref:peptidoglycan editing factor PgeF n=1 Tax=Curvibacter microcysteis TaxID=3026419 RepID=UPI0023601501|nr:peptidoglycan editing factor PgeF [Curvibacter sp. RS43]MDD0809205.1 peptidoglycan editing factor PgeF [Curvibacter sp. RS43]
MSEPLPLAPGAYLAPDWPAPPGVRALCTTRAGGVSAAPWDSLNLGAHVQDDPAHVAANRAILQAEVARRGGGELLFLNQVHGQRVLRLAPGAALPQGQDADGVLAAQPGVALVMMVADCLPVLFTDTEGRRVAAVHAGWRGLAGGILEAAVASLAAPAEDGPGVPATSVMAWLGPCIGPSAFEVGPEVREAFVQADPAAASAFAAQPDGRWLADLPALARQRLAASGVSAVYGNDGTKPWCTCSDSTLFFSHRRDSRRFGHTGRLAACIWRV